MKKTKGFKTLIEKGAKDKIREEESHKKQKEDKFM